MKKWIWALLIVGIGMYMFKSPRNVPAPAALRSDAPAAVSSSAAVADVTGMQASGANVTASDISGTPIRVLAGSELKDLEFLKPALEKAAGRPVQFVYTGTLDAADRLKQGGADFDFAWLASNRYLSLAAPGVVKASDKIMLSPVILGVRESKAHVLGWDHVDPTWGDIAAAVKAKQFVYGMTNPAASNSGFSAVVGVAAALSGKSDGVQLNDIPTLQLKTFFSGQKLTSGSSGWLADAYVKSPDGLDGIINYESVILSLNAGDWPGGRPAEKLVPVYPKEGIITSDYPLSLINERRRAVFEQWKAILKSEPVQRQIMERTHRRSVVPQVALAPEFGDKLLIELPFPSSLSVLDGLLTQFLDTISVPGHAYFVLDVSGSMAGTRLKELQTGLLGLAVPDTNSATAKYSRFRLREKVDLIAFSSKVMGTQAFDFEANQQAVQLNQYNGFVSHLAPLGGTAIYTALAEACQRAARDNQHDMDRYYSIVLMTDGENNSGLDFNEFAGLYKRPGGCPARIFPILFGEGNNEEMEGIAQLSHGRTFDGRKNTLSEVFRDIRGYQ